jgi:hypothetical protein
MSKSLTQNSRIIAKKGVFQGREVLAFFSVVEGVNGYSVRLVGVRNLQAENADIVALAKVQTKNIPVVSIKIPFFEASNNLVSDFSFLISQPARAPSF